MTWEYLAGFIDGEGTIAKKYRGYVLHITQANFEVLEKIRCFTKKGAIYSITKRKNHWKDAWIYSSGSNENTYYILNHTAAHLIVKKQNALEALTELKVRFKELEKRDSLREDRTERAKKLRKQGLTYREIGRILKADFGYIRRLILSK